MSAHSLSARPLITRWPGGRLFTSRTAWLSIAIAAALAIALPLGSLSWFAVTADENVWPHLMATVLPGYIGTTLLLMAGAGGLAAVIGTSCAWLVVMCRFPGRRLLSWALMLPLAAPTYIIAYLYTGLLSYSGPVQSFIRQTFGFASARDYWFPEIRSTGGAILLMGLTLYPYVYMLARTAFAEQGPAAIEAARTLGDNPWAAFRRIALPMARPSIAIGTALVMMEALNDFGTVDYFAIRTMTAGVYNVWLKMQNAGGAAQIALAMLAIVLALLMLERAGRNRQRQYQGGARRSPATPFELSGIPAIAAAAACLLPVILGFVLPIAVLVQMAITNFGDAWNPALIQSAANSFKLAAVVALLCLVAGTLVAYGRRLLHSPAFDLLANIASLGYALPGAVLALGVLMPLGQLDNRIDALSRQMFGLPTGLLLSGTMTALAFALIVRFFALGYGAIDNGLGRIRPSIDMAARSLGATPGGAFIRVHLPLLGGSAMTAFLLVFVDAMKELPATLILRPFNFDTLATQVYQHAATEQLELASLGAVAIVLAGLAPVIILNRAMLREVAP